MVRTRKLCKEVQLFCLGFFCVSVETRNNGINYHRLHSQQSLLALAFKFYTLMNLFWLFYSLSLITVCLVFALRFCVFCHYPFCQAFLMCVIFSLFSSSFIRLWTKETIDSSVVSINFIFVFFLAL